MSSWLLYLLPALIGIVATIVWLAISLFNYANRQRVQLDGVVDLDAAINTLSAHFKEGNVDILNRHIGADQYEDWHAQWVLWQSKVATHLEATMGLAEKNMFENLVVYQPLANIGGVSSHIC